LLHLDARQGALEEEMRAYLLGIAAALAFAPPAVAQEDPDEGLICVTVAHIWSGSPEDIARIDQVPVPESFRRIFEGGGCGRFSLLPDSLISWHLAFGNESSFAAALEYLERDYAGGKPPLADLAARIAAARARADADIRAAAALDRNPATRAQGDRLLRRSKPVGELVTLLAAYRNYVFVAGESLRGAEFYRSRALLDRARAWAEPASQAFAALRKQAAADRAEKLEVRGYLGLDDYVARLATELEMRAAVVRAALTKDAGDIAHADEVIKSFENPFYRTAGDEAFNHGDDFCDIGDRDDLADYHEACESGDFEREAIAWWHYRARLDILRADAGKLNFLPSLYTAIRLSERDEEGHTDSQGTRRLTPAADQRAALHLMRADAFVRGAASPRVAADATSNAELLSQAADSLARAEALIPASEHPGRFRQIATRYLDIAARLAALLRADPHAHYAGDPAIARKAVYFRAVLDRLDAIALARP
jgi:hypothetical protein